MNSKNLILGIFLLISFVVIFILIFMPIFGNGRNGLMFSDDFFNSLAKGSSNYMDSMRKLAQPLVGKPFAAEIKMSNSKQAQQTEILYQQAGAQVEVAGPALKITGDLGQVMLKSVDDAEAMFNNQGEKLQAQYHYAAKAALKNWWVSFDKLDGALKKQKKFKEAKAIAEVQKRALEPGYNFYGIIPSSVGDHAGMLIFMLVFYVVYTLWYGYGIFEVFQGIGLGMHKAAHKEEV
jgi:predicted metalloprotease with PDZ domain